MSDKYGTRRLKTKEQTRNIIFHTAYELFEEKGYEKSTMREIAARAGVGLGTICRHFKDKPTLLVSVFMHEFQPVFTNAFDTVPDTDLKNQLLYLVKQFYAYYAKRPTVSRTLLRELFIDPKNSEKIRENYLNDLGRLVILFEAAKKRGELAADVDATDAVAVWWSYYTLVLWQAVQKPVFNVDEEIAFFQRLMDQHFRGIEKFSR